MNILVAGAQGRLGMQIVDLLLEKEHNVLAMVQEESQGDELKKLGAKITMADLRQSVEFAVEGCEAVIFAARSKSDDPEDIVAVERDGLVKMVKACENNAVERFVFVSQLGTKHPEKAEGMEQIHLKAKSEAEKQLKKSSLNYTIIRHGLLNDDPESGMIIVKEDLKGTSGQITRLDLAHTVAEVLENEHTYHRELEVINGNRPIEEALNQL